MEHTKISTSLSQSLLWNCGILSIILANTKDRSIGKPEFLKLKRIIEDKYPELYKKHSQKQAIKYQKKKLLKDMQSGNAAKG